MKHIIQGLEFVRQEHDTCLFSCFASLLKYRGLNDNIYLGSVWNANFPLNGVRNEEYYVALTNKSLAEAIVPGTGWRSKWITAENSKLGWEYLVEELKRGYPVPLAVDNFFLPFRPAYQDVHSKHLLLAYGFDTKAGTAYVLDATPPKFSGPISINDLQMARGSMNRSEGARDYFFADAEIAFDFLEIRSNEENPISDIARLLFSSIDRSLAEMKSQESTKDLLVGLDGIECLAGKLRDCPKNYVQDIFVFSGTILAQRSRYAAFLSKASVSLASPELKSLSELTQNVAFLWGTLRILCSREARENNENLGQRISQKLREIMVAEGQVLNGLDEFSNQR